MRTAILSNGSPKMLDAVVRAAKLDTLLDAVLSVEEVGVYKPHPKVYQLAIDRLGRHPQSHSSRQTPGMPMRHQHSECESFGAIAMVSGGNDCLAPQITK
jgi:hypothetical protein